MKSSSNGCVFLIFLLLAILVIMSSSSARPLPHHQRVTGEEEKGNSIIMGTQVEVEDIRDLMGAEESEGQECDDECGKRRMIAEAHLDYIYTQSHKP